MQNHERRRVLQAGLGAAATGAASAYAGIKAFLGGAL